MLDPMIEVIVYAWSSFIAFCFPSKAMLDDEAVKSEWSDDPNAEPPREWTPISPRAQEFSDG